MHARTRTVAAVVSLPVALGGVAGPLAGPALADRPTPVLGVFAVERNSLRPVSAQTHGNMTVNTFTERTRDTGKVFPGVSATTWTCAKRDRTSVSRCTGDSLFEGTYQGVTGTAAVRLTATCTDDGAPLPFVTCEGRFRLDGLGVFEGLHGQGTWQSAGLFTQTVQGTSELLLHDHR